MQTIDYIKENPRAIVDYQKCRPGDCGNGTCVASLQCPNQVLTQEEPFDFPYSRPSRFCKGCATCVDACPYHAIRVVKQ